MVSVSSILLLLFLPSSDVFSFVPSQIQYHVIRQIHSTENEHYNTLLNAINSNRRKQLGISDDEDEYDLDVALGANTDARITKIIAGSFILVMIALLVVGLVIPSLTDYGAKFIVVNCYL